MSGALLADLAIGLGVLMMGVVVGACATYLYLRGVGDLRKILSLVRDTRCMRRDKADLIRTLDFVLETVHRVYHGQEHADDISTCQKSTCDAAKRALARVS